MMLVPWGNEVCVTALCTGLGEWLQGEALPWMEVLLVLY